MDKQVRVGVACFVYNDNNEFLMLKREGSHGAGTWALPGGHVEFGETYAYAAFREVEEEVGLQIEAEHVVKGGWTEWIDADHHYISIVCAAYTRRRIPTPKIMEPAKCSELRWVKHAGPFPEPLFTPLGLYLIHNDPPLPTPR